VSQLIYSLELAFKDLVRLWSGTRHHVVIVAGICLPILMLLGLKRGHVETLRKDLVTSPTGRQVIFWSARQGELMDRTAVDRLATELPSVDVLIPETQRLVRIRAGVGAELRELESATLYATRPGDPLLSQVGLSAPARGRNEVVLGDGLAAGLGVGVGGEVVISLTRGQGDQADSVEVALRVSAVMPTTEHGAAVGYIDLDLLDRFDAYVRGQRVAEFGWSSAKSPAADSYSGYLVLCETSSDLTDDDRQFYAERGLLLTDVTVAPPLPLPDLLVRDYADRLRVYVALTQASPSDSPSVAPSRLRIAPSELSEGTQADEVVLPWNPPRYESVEGHQLFLVGLSLPRRTWLREYFRDRDLPFDYEADPFTGQLFAGLDPTGDTARLFAQTIAWPLSGGGNVPLALKPLQRTTVESAPVEPLLDSPPNTGPGSPAAGSSRAESTAADIRSPDLPAAKGERSETNQSAAETAHVVSQATPPNSVSSPAPGPAIRTETDAISPPAENPAPSKPLETPQQESNRVLPLIVPASLLAWVSAHADGVVEYDSDIRLFIPRQQPAIYDRVRLYARTIDDVPRLVTALAERRFAVMSETGRITEIQRQDDSLQSLVWVVGAGVFLFGTLTVFSVLMDSTDRKRGVIGILRVMGMSRVGIFVSILLRSMVIGALAAALGLACGWGLKLLLGWQPELSLWKWKPVISVELVLVDLVLVAAGAMLCCGLGAIPPAWRASRLDPFDAIVEGKFR
jgi:ABC-type lipoprotein release transport system permease subunit